MQLVKTVKAKIYTLLNSYRWIWNVVTAFPINDEVNTMNFYIGNSVNEININDYNVELDDGLMSNY